jgi:hypothetical protein
LENDFMSKHPSKQNRIVSDDPSDMTGRPGHPQKEEKQKPGEGSTRKVGSSNSRESFDDDYESKAEDEISREEAATERDGRTGKS